MYLHPELVAFEFCRPIRLYRLPIRSQSGVLGRNMVSAELAETMPMLNRAIHISRASAELRSHLVSLYFQICEHLRHLFVSSVDCALYRGLPRCFVSIRELPMSEDTIKHVGRSCSAWTPMRADPVIGTR